MPASVEDFESAQNPQPESCYPDYGGAKKKGIWFGDMCSYGSHAAMLGICHTWLQKVVRAFNADPDEILRLQSQGDATFLAGPRFSDAAPHQLALSRPYFQKIEQTGPRLDGEAFAVKQPISARIEVDTRTDEIVASDDGIRFGVGCKSCQRESKFRQQNAMRLLEHSGQEPKPA